VLDALSAAVSRSSLAPSEPAGQRLSYTTLPPSGTSAPFLSAMRVGWHISREPQDCDGAENLPRLVGGLSLRLGPDATHISRARSNPTFNL
jgi:hypothetical protein